MRKHVHVYIRIQGAAEHIDEVNCSIILYAEGDEICNYIK